MKDFIVRHTFKSEATKKQYFAILETMSEEQVRDQMKNDSASFQMQWNNGGAGNVVYCWWKANDKAAILSTLGPIGDMFDNEILEMANVIDVSD